ncbi:MAG: helix-hairpin-helix domain-containing protein [Saprospiraceae bacterium]|nr:helix-hairpin-helix domain-containing protein [Saprospiraceae bacterium]
MFAYILLQCSFWDHLPTALALCLLPFLLGWLAAYAWYKVGPLRDQVANLTTANGKLEGDLTDLRVRYAAIEADLDSKNNQLHKLRDDLMMCESERNALREQTTGTGGSGKAAKSVAAAAATILFAGTKYKTDDLKIVEGIGPKIAELLNNADIRTWRQLADTAVERLREILDAAGSAYQIHDPGTWPQQADLADRGEWDALKKLQDELTAGRAD